MKIKLLVIGKTDETSIRELIHKYTKRIKGFTSFELEIIPDLKNHNNLSQQLQKEKEGNLLLQKISSSDYVVLLDEKGQEMTSVGFADFLQKKMNTGLKNLIFIIGGPYGFSKEIYQRANAKIALSKMTFSHQIVRPVFLEQLYRGLTILHNHPYHHA